MPTLTTAQVVQLVGRPRRTIMQWLEDGLILPDTPYRKRHGARVLWSAKMTREALLISQLRGLGLSLQALRRVTTDLQALGHNPLSSGQFLVLGGAVGQPTELVKLCEGPNGATEALSLMRGGRGQLLLPLELPTDDDLDRLLTGELPTADLPEGAAMTA